MVDKPTTATNQVKFSVEEALDAYIPQLRAAKTLYLAFSGGLDSTVLFHLLLARKLKFTALHFNHGLSSHAGEWQDFCERLCAQYRMPCISFQGSIGIRGQGLEEAARAARYEFFMQHLVEGDVLLTAHHANDQAETLLFRLLRGSGLRGLAAIPAERELGPAKLLRPLLNLTRQDLHTFAIDNELRWVEDESNENKNFSRNFLRHEIISRLQTRWPNSIEKISECSEQLASEANLLQEYAAEDLQHCEPQKARAGKSLDLNILRRFSEPRQAAILREWFRQEHYLPFTRPQFQQILGVVHANEDARPLVETQSWQIRRFNQRLYLLPQLEADLVLTSSPLQWNSENVQDLGDATLSCSAGPKVEFTIAFRRGGERCQPLTRKHSTTLKHLLQEYKLEPWWRERVPLIFYQDELCAVGDLFVCKAGEHWQFKWEFKAKNNKFSSR